MKALAVIVVVMSERPTPPSMADPTIVHSHVTGAADPTIVHAHVAGFDDPTTVHANVADPDDPTVAHAHVAGSDGATIAPSHTTGAGAASAAAVPAAGPSMAPVLAAAAIGGAVSLSLGVYGRIHGPTGDTIFAFGFPTLLSMKAWFTTVAAALGIFQALSAAWMWGRLPGLGVAPSRVATWHRWTGTLAFFFTLPVAYHCLWSLGFQDTNLRVLAHSILGCAFYGALTAKLLLLRSNRLPGWTLPVAGGLLVAVLTAIWFTSSLWFFTTVGFPSI